MYPIPLGVFLLDAPLSVTGGSRWLLGRATTLPVIIHTP